MPHSAYSADCNMRAMPDIPVLPVQKGCFWLIPSVDGTARDYCDVLVEACTKHRDDAMFCCLAVQREVSAHGSLYILSIE
jgi:hypothetical protein